MNTSTVSFQLHGSKFQRGFTLVELMIAMGIGAFISAGVIALFVGNNRGYEASAAMARVQENGRFAIEYLAQDIRQAGLQNFKSSKLLPNKENPWPPKDYIKGWNGVGTKPTLVVGKDPNFWSHLDDKKGKDWSNLGDYTKNTDVIGIRYLDPESDFKPGKDDTDPNTDFGPDDSDDEIDPYVVNHVYYVAPSSVTGQPGLYQKIDSSDAQELIECVYDMQVRYGVDNTGDGQIDNYVNVPLDWDQVFSIKIDLIVGSTDNNLVETPMSLPFEKNDGTFFTATDRRIYQMFSATIALRNRIK
ncbi:hypothetical protein CKO12_00860 [Chromatium okenii]|uniref:PilW family protein n=1 Tax=Chromatium okenii TaxID=61644 RepID=UPI0019036246|nr:PilW family protein [Chromatium okenii]MBK1640453.1 hypothetical protein [Chromatium okenii]